MARYGSPSRVTSVGESVIRGRVRERTVEGWPSSSQQICPRVEIGKPSPGTTGEPCSQPPDGVAEIMPRRKAAFGKVVAQIEADKPLIYLYHEALIFAYSTKLQGYKQPPDGIIRIQDLKLAR